jgi:hypothetical protein
MIYGSALPSAGSVELVKRASLLASTASMENPLALLPLAAV